MNQPQIYMYTWKISLYYNTNDSFLFPFLTYLLNIYPGVDMVSYWYLDKKD